MTTNHSITTISELSGFSSHTNFTNQFKKHLEASPKQFRTMLNQLEPLPSILIRSSVSQSFLNLISQFEFTNHLTTETTQIDIANYDPKDQTQFSTAFIDFQNINELFQFVFNDYFDIDLSYLPRPAILINDVSDMVGRHTN